MTLVRVDFNPQDFEDLIQQKGYRLLWEKAVMCPCLDPTTHRAVEGCPQCNSRGKFYLDGKEIKGIITRQNKEMQIGDVMGVLEPGNAYLTISSIYQLTKFDRVTNLDSLVVTTEILLQDDEETTLRFDPVTIDFMGIQPTRKSNIVPLQNNVDYTVSATGGVITWISSKKPSNGQGITVRYSHHPSWLVTDTPNYVRDTFVKEGNVVDTSVPMPIRVQIRLEQLGEGIAND